MLGPTVTTTSRLLLLLQRVQETALGIFGPSGFDAKRYVDLSLRFDLPSTEQALEHLSVRGPENGSPSSARDFEAFLRHHFEGEGEDLEPHDPEDFHPDPVGFLPRVEDPEVRAWALEVHALWRILSRKVADKVRARPELYTVIPVPHPFMIAGSRFREMYYWDSYWVVRGLLASKMYDTAKAIVKNLVALANHYGFVLNGARAYYTNRSQPPLLSAMIRDIYHITNDIELVKLSLSALLKEHEFWNSGNHKVTIRSADGHLHCLSRYYAMWNKPRPESSTIDKRSASKIANVGEKEKLYCELASAAESGWDFSTRWMRNPSDFTTMATTSVLPVDLNAFLLGMECDIAFFAEMTGDQSTVESFRNASRARQEAINSIFWNEEKGQWLDYWLDGDSSKEPHKWTASNQNETVYASNFIPLWTEPVHSDPQLVERVMNSLKNSGLLCSAGVAASLENSGQQWDFPNGWAPLQHLIVEGLVKSGRQDAWTMAKDIATRWIKTNYKVYRKTNYMHEKFDVRSPGEFGVGGEYVSQTGFGWSNGVVLSFLEEFGWSRDQKIYLE